MKILSFLKIFIFSFVKYLGRLKNFFIFSKNFVDFWKFFRFSWGIYRNGPKNFCHFWKILSIFENFDDRKILFWNFPRESPCPSWVTKCHFWTKNSKNFDHFCKKTRESASLLIEKSEKFQFWVTPFSRSFFENFQILKISTGGYTWKFCHFWKFLFFPL